MGSLSIIVIEKSLSFLFDFIKPLFALIVASQPITVSSRTSVLFNILRKLTFQEATRIATIPESMMGPKFMGDPGYKYTLSV